jgi:hypothetical protein
MKRTAPPRLSSSAWRSRSGDRGLADAGGSENRDEPLLDGPRGECPDRVVAARHSFEPRRQVVRDRRRRGLRDARRRLDVGIGSNDGRDEAVAAPCDGRDVTRAVHAISQGLAEIADVNAKRTLDNNDIGPDTRDELCLADDLAGLPHERDQDIERASTEIHRCAVTFQC